MFLQLIIKNNQVTLKLKDKRKAVGTRVFPADQNLSELLLVEIDVLLSENKLTTSNISRYSLRSDIAENYTTYRIAKSVINALNWGNLRNF